MVIGGSTAGGMDTGNVIMEVSGVSQKGVKAAVGIGPRKGAIMVAGQVMLRAQVAVEG